MQFIRGVLKKHAKYGIKGDLDAAILRAANGEGCLSAPREDVYRAALEEIASGLSTRNPYDIANEALK